MKNNKENKQHKKGKALYIVIAIFVLLFTFMLITETLAVNNNYKSNSIIGSITALKEKVTAAITTLKNNNSDLSEQIILLNSDIETLTSDKEQLQNDLILLQSDYDELENLNNNNQSESQEQVENLMLELDDVESEIDLLNIYIDSLLEIDDGEETNIYLSYSEQQLYDLITSDFGVNLQTIYKPNLNDNIFSITIQGYTMEGLLKDIGYSDVDINSGKIVFTYDHQSEERITTFTYTTDDYTIVVIYSRKNSLLKSITVME
jgi:cell division protein FtsB